MTDADKPANPIAPGSDLRLTGPHWAFIIKLYGSPDVQQACLLLQDGFGVDVSFLLTLLWYARDGAELESGDVEALDRAIASWRGDVVMPLRNMRREIKPAAEHDGVVADFRNQIKSIEIQAEQIEIAMLVRAMDRRKRPGASGASMQPASIARTVETVLAFYAARAAALPAKLQTPETRAAIKVLADAAAHANSELR
jgi:uncharacterized protein (TIGR02444 family)